MRRSLEVSVNKYPMGLETTSAYQRLQTQAASETHQRHAHRDAQAQANIDDQSRCTYLPHLKSPCIFCKSSGIHSSCAFGDLFGSLSEIQRIMKIVKLVQLLKLVELAKLVKLVQLVLDTLHFIVLPLYEQTSRKHEKIFSMALEGGGREEGRRGGGGGDESTPTMDRNKTLLDKKTCPLQSLQSSGQPV